ncbi:hypothetical protein [Sedimentitalea nanhaiensis]|uniref:Uncharacterized protein n=1 Tax=Sedimentitalea nanhaiensis TaxID=999627 RepID=A0A1I7BJ59_9RHOB|nr:hypothetical protein [Sedimentitalea nanhaiensis]SFT87210.1 hypothetical protein SAMN05216236_11097 [Sedimentitalea nanhaiensis]
MPDDPILADSITKLGDSAQGRVAVTGSHGGVYAAFLARRAGLRAVVFHDAGVGLDGAGIGGLDWLAAQGMAAAAIDHASAAIGQAEQMAAHGVISHVNVPAAALGVQAGMTCSAAAQRLCAAVMPCCDGPPVREGREVMTLPGATRQLILVDSASLVRAEDAGQVIVTGSHGALFGADPANALKADGYLAVFNDAGGAATSRLPLLQDRGVAAAAVAAMSARIGDARSTWEDGVVSALNSRATDIGGQVGMTACDLVTLAVSR